MRIDAARSSGSLGNAPNEPLVVGQHGKHTDDDLQKLDERHFSGRLTLLIITFSERFPRTTTWLKLRQVANIKGAESPLLPLPVQLEISMHIVLTVF